jgi:hypothetical protein
MTVWVSAQAHQPLRIIPVIFATSFQLVEQASVPPLFFIPFIHADGQLALAASQGALMLFSKFLPRCPASGRFAVSAQSAQADFVSPAPDINPGNQGYRSSVDQSGNNQLSSISACVTRKPASPCELFPLSPWERGQGVRDALRSGRTHKNHPLPRQPKRI